MAIFDRFRQVRHSKAELLIIETFRSRGNPWISRVNLWEITGLRDFRLTRALQNLSQAGIVQKKTEKNIPFYKLTKGWE